MEEVRLQDKFIQTKSETDELPTTVDVLVYEDNLALVVPAGPHATVLHSQAGRCIQSIPFWEHAGAVQARQRAQQSFLSKGYRRLSMGPQAADALQALMRKAGFTAQMLTQATARFAR